MEQRTLGKTGLKVSAITLGGGGIGMVWGPTTDQECIETVKQAVASGINIIDVAPIYGRGKAEEIVGRAWPELEPKPLIATKVFVMPGERSDPGGAVRRSIEASLSRMHLDRVDILQLHNQVEPGEPVSPRRLTLREVTGAGGLFEAMHRLKEEGLVGAIGFTGIARHDAVRELLKDGRPATIQLVTNLLCSEGEMGAASDAPYRDHLEIVRLASDARLGVFGIRPFAAGSLTDRIDRDLPDSHPVAADFALVQRELSFLTRETGDSMSFVAMRYALSLPGVSTVVTGAKNRIELAEAVAAAEAGPLPDAHAIMERISSWQKARATA